MPEGLEAEIWRRSMERLIGRTISNVWLDERVDDPGVAALVGHTIDHVVRHGKVVQLGVGGDALGLHFGMTGRVVVDGTAPIRALEYSSSRDCPAWDTLRLFTTDQGAHQAANATPALRVNDPRRLGRVSLDADLSSLGIDMFEVSAETLTAALTHRRAAIKTLLLDQSVVAGLGNLCADEALWWSGIAPSRRADDLGPGEVRALASAIRRRLPIMLRRGGSTTGELDPALRASRGPCPRDGAVLERATIGGRTTVWCPGHQR